MATLLKKTQGRVPAVVMELRQRVQSGLWQPRQRIQTERELSKEFGVSRGTIIASLRELEREGLIAPRRGDGRYVVDPAERQRHCALGMVIFDMKDVGHPAVTGILAGIRDQCAGAGYHLNIFAFNSAVTAVANEDTMGGLSQISPSAIDGVILQHSNIPDEQVLALSRHIPVVWMGHVRLSERVGGVRHDLSGGTFDAVDHLLQLGHRRISLVTVQEKFSQGQMQREGAQLGMRRLNAAGEGQLAVFSAQSNHSDEWVNDFAQLMKRDVRPTAIIFGSDDLAARGLKVIAELGLQIPRDLSVISTNDLAALSPVPLTSIHCDYMQLGSVSSSMLLNMIGDPSAEHETQRLPVQLVVRESTAPPSVRSGQR